MTEPAKPPRTPWRSFSDVLIHASETAVKQHPAYRAAKSGSADAALALVGDTVNEEQNLRRVQLFAGHAPTLVSAHAFEREGVNAIPEVFANVLGEALSWPVDSGVVQLNAVFHTGSDGFARLALQAVSPRGSCACRSSLDGQTPLRKTRVDARATGRTEEQTWNRTRKRVARQIRSRLRRAY